MLYLPALEDELSNINISVCINSVRQISSKLVFTPKYTNYASVLPEKKNPTNQLTFSSFLILFIFPSYLIYQ